MNVVSDMIQRTPPINQTSDDPKWDLQTIIEVAKRRGKVVLVSLLACVALAAAYLLVTPDSFTATAVLMADTKQTPPSPSQVSSEPLIDPAVIESQIEILKSQRIAADVVDQLHLDHDPEFAGGGPSLKARLLAQLSHRPIAPPTKEALRISAIESLLHKEKITRIGHSYLAEVAVSTLDPQKSADVANAVADAYIQDQLDGRMQANQRSATWMKQRVDAVKAQADAASAALDLFRRQHAPGSEGVTAAPGPAPRDEARLAFAVHQGEADRLAALDPVEPVTPSKLDALSAIDDPAIRQLVGELRRGSPAVQAGLAASIQARLTQLLADSRSKLKTDQQSFTAGTKVGDAAPPADAAGDASSRRLKELTSAAESARSDFDVLQNRYVRLTQFMQQQSLPVTEARVLTSAQPPLVKTAPKSTVILLLATVGGLVLGAGLAAGRESLDRRIRWPHQIKQTLGLPLAGALPLVKKLSIIGTPDRAMSVSRLEAKLIGDRRAGLATLFDSRRPWCAATQTLRIIKLAIDQGARRSQGAAVGIVSTWPGEGKSTLTHNLAQMLAETGAKVLVIDADLHKSDLSTTFAPDAKRGVADFVDGLAPLHDCVTATTFGFDLLSRGAAPPPLHPFHMLGSGAMQRALAAAQHSYDYVLLDLPALMTSVDAQAAAGFVEAFVLVTCSGRATIDEMEQALSTSDIIPSRIVAAVLNKSRLADRGVRRAVRGRRSVIEAAA